MHDVNPMRAKIGHRAAAEIPEPAPAIEFFFGKSVRRCVAEPLLPIERLCVNGLEIRPRLVILPPIGANLRHTPDASALNQVDRIAEVAPATLLHAALQNFLVGMHGVD